MAGILGRSQFLSETVNLFTDEKTASARAKVVEWINELAVSNEAQTKCELLVKVQETIVGSCVELLEEFLEPVLSMAHDSNMDVRKQVVCFMEQVCRVKVDLLPQFINIVYMLLRDRAPQVIKRVIQACGGIYKSGLQWICTHSDSVVTDSVEQTWNHLSLIKVEILDLIDNDNDGIRTNSIKFLEGIVVLQSYPDEDSQQKDNDFSLEDVPAQLKLLKRDKLEEEALHIFDILLQFHAATHISSVNLIACTGSLCTIAKLRPSFMSAVVEAFKQLNSNLPPTLTDSQVSSVRKSLKMQLIALLKNRASYEHQAVLRTLLLELGTSGSEIQRHIPKMDKQEQTRRQKRILEQATSSSNNASKRARLSLERNTLIKLDEMLPSCPEKPKDESDLEQQRQKSTRVNEKFLSEQLRSPAVAVNLVLEFLPRLPPTAPAAFLSHYVPLGQLNMPQLVASISQALAEQLTQQKLGPGAAAFRRETPPSEEDQLRKQEATKKLRDNIERLKGEQELIERMKQRAKTLKLQEVTKPFARPLKEKYLLEAVKRILQAERQCLAAGVSARRRKILTVVAATFPDNVRYFISDFILQDIRQRIDLAFCWLYEEYCLLQGFTRHSYVKSEHRPDHAYNELMSQLIAGVSEKCEFKDKILLLRRIFLEAPLLPESAIEQLLQLCQQQEYSSHSLELLKDLALLRPPRRNKFLRLLLTFCVHEQKDLRACACALIVTLYHEHKLLPHRIDEYALEWLGYLEQPVPPACIFTQNLGRPEVQSSWQEPSSRICLQLALTLMPYNTELYLGKLCQLYIACLPELKRTILRCIDAAIKEVGAAAPALLQLIEQCPKGSETLIIRIIYILTERVGTPTASLVQHVRDLYAHKLQDVRVLIPVLAGLTRAEILAALPKLIKLNQLVVREVFNRLLNIGAEYAAQNLPVTPADILVALHNIDVNACDLKCVVKATALCLAEKQVYTQEVLTLVLHQLVDMVPLPTLLMRTIIQSLTLYPQLANYVLQLLQRLILKQVWRFKVIWEGFLKCCQRLKPQSLPVLLQLPLPQLQSALQQCPDMRAPLLEYAESIREEPMSGITPQLIDIISGKAVDVFVTDESGGYIALENIKKEVEDPMETNSLLTICTTTEPVPAPVQTPLSATGTMQPLPPGED